MKKDLISGLLGALVSLLIFALTYVLLEPIYIDKFLPRSKIEAIIYFPTIIFAPISALAIHELGHLITGIVLGQKFKLFVVAFFGVEENNGKIKIFLNKNLAYFGGIMAVVPKSINDINYKIFAKILISGPITSFLYGIFCLLIFFNFDTYLNSFFGLSALTSLGLFLATTIPNKSGIMFTDRKRFQRLISKGKSQDAEIAMYQILSQSIIENSFKNIDIEKTYIVEKDVDFEMKFWAEYLRFLYYKENILHEDMESSKTNLMNFKANIGKNVWKSLNID